MVGLDWNCYFLLGNVFWSKFVCIVISPRETPVWPLSEFSVMALFLLTDLGTQPLELRCSLVASLNPDWVTCRTCLLFMTVVEVLWGVSIEGMFGFILGAERQ